MNEKELEEKFNNLVKWFDETEKKIIVLLEKAEKLGEKFANFLDNEVKKFVYEQILEYHRDKFGYEQRTRKELYERQNKDKK